MSSAARGCAISAFKELRELGYFGIECLTLVQDLVREEVRKFPVLAPENLELDDVVQDFLVDRLKAVTVTLAVQAGDDASFARLLRRTIRNWLIDRARQTDIGHLRRSVEKVLADEDAFEQVPAKQPGAGRWRLRGTAGEPWSGDPSELVAAAWAVPGVKVPKWSSASRRPPVTDRSSMIAVLRAVFETASGSLEVGQIVEVFVRRFGGVLDPLVVPLNDPSASALADDTPTAEDYVITSDAELDAAMKAAEIIGVLSPDERRLAPHLANPSSLQDTLKVGRAQAYQHAANLKKKIVELAGGRDDAEQVVLELIRLCGGVAEQ
ncbi:hypothetical protein C8D88_102769 [Lentzea atacamensis]|uniref:Uncharacterized protein n=1 Tax=Lentzea atacamensis TaxID=531938 RepID=A0A316IQT3_9PSEU|nr:hypothetical protein C8D88_102769 [Lentzea atacamensis]